MASWKKEQQQYMLSCGVGQVGQIWAFASPAYILLLHLPGTLKFDPPGSTCWWCFLLPKSSAGKEYGVLLLKWVNILLNNLRGVCRGSRPMAHMACITCELRVVGIVSVQGDGGGSSGLSSYSTGNGGTWRVASRGSVTIQPHFSFYPQTPCPSSQHQTSRPSSHYHWTHHP